MKIPIYQRDYAWGPEDVDNLMDLFFEAAPESDGPIFLGNMVFHSEPDGDDNAWYLVDGQQRLSTTYLIIASMLHRLRKSEHLRAGTIAAEYIKLLTTEDGIIDTNEKIQSNKIRLRMSDKDHHRFRDFIVLGEVIDRRTRLGKAQRRISNRINEMAFNDSKLIENAVNLYRSLESVVCATSIDVEDPIDPLAVFESLNSRGVRLSESDLLKNYVMQRTNQHDRDDTLARWRTIESNIDERIVSFLRAWHLATQGLVRKNDLYRKFKKLVNEQGATPTLVELVKWSEYYRDISNASPARFTQDELRRRIREFNGLGFQQAMPLLLAAIDHTPSPKQLIRLIDMLECAYIRLFRTRQIRGSLVENEFIDLCKYYVIGLEEGLAESSKVIRRLCEAYCPSMENEWPRLEVNSTADQAFILRRLEQASQGNISWVPSSTSLVEIEHILPKSLDKKYNYGVSEDQHERLVNRIGNLCLVLEEHNPRLGNKLFELKKHIYSWYDGSLHQGDPVQGHRRHDLTHKLWSESASTWGESEIETRGQQLGALADRAWPIP